MIWNTSYKSNLFAVDVRFCLGYPLPPIIHLTFRTEFLGAAKRWRVSCLVASRLPFYISGYWREVQAQAEEFKYIRVLFRSEEEWTGKREWCSVSSN